LRPEVKLSGGDRRRMMRSVLGAQTRGVEA
jgi:hypothetical protein